MNKKIAIIFTGGTISMKIDDELSAAVPSLSGEEIMRYVTHLDKKAHVEINNFSALPSPFVGPDMMFDLAELIEDYLKRDDIDAVVITHGTDTLEETAYFLDLKLKTEKPIVITGSMRNGSELGYDGPSNLAAAVCAAVSDYSRNKGVIVVMNDEVFAAREVTKTHTLTLDTFQSVEFGPLGIVDHNEVIYYRNVTSPSPYIPADDIERNVHLLKMTAGFDKKLFDYLVDQGAKGLVIEAFGRGNVPPTLVPSIERALKRGVKIVLVSRCPQGRVLDTYGYDGGGKMLRELGVIFGGSLNGQKARLKLILALGYNNDYDYIKNIFENDL